MIGEQFLNPEGKWILNFKTEEEYEKQMRDVRKAIRETTTGEDFDILDGYLQSLRNSYANMLVEKERAEYFKNL